MYESDESDESDHDICDDLDVLTLVSNSNYERVMRLARQQHMVLALRQHEETWVKLLHADDVDAHRCGAVVLAELSLCPPSSLPRIYELLDTTACAHVERACHIMLRYI